MQYGSPGCFGFATANRGSVCGCPRSTSHHEGVHLSHSILHCSTYSNRQPRQGAIRSIRPGGSRDFHQLPPRTRDDACVPKGDSFAGRRSAQFDDLSLAPRTLSQSCTILRGPLGPMPPITLSSLTHLSHTLYSHSTRPHSTRNRYLPRLPATDAAANRSPSLWDLVIHTPTNPTWPCLASSRSPD
jgi:hypothetical protein